MRTVIQSPAVYEAIRAKGIDFATVESCLSAAMRIACDKDINGISSAAKLSTLLTGVLGHSFAIVPYSTVKEGFLDLDEDDRVDEDHWLVKFQNDTIRLRGDDWH